MASVPTLLAVVLVAVVSTARERLIDAARYEYVVGRDTVVALDAFLAHPDDLIALLVERGALEPIVGGEVDDDGNFYTFTTDTYRQVREEGRDG